MPLVLFAVLLSLHDILEAVGIPPPSKHGVVEGVGSPHITTCWKQLQRHLFLLQIT